MDKTFDSSQPESDVAVEDLTVVADEETARQALTFEATDRDDRPVADTARELPSEQVKAIEEEGDWAGDAGNHLGDDAQCLSDQERT